MTNGPRQSDGGNGNSLILVAQPYPFTSYTYDLLDDVLSMGMPSGRTIATNYDSSGRPISVKGTLGANTTQYVSSVRSLLRYGPPLSGPQQS